MWCTYREGPDFQYLTLLVTGYGHGVWCELDLPEEEIVQPVLAINPEKSRGHPITEAVKIHGLDSASMVGVESSLHMDTDIEQMMDFPVSEKKIPLDLGTAKTRVCPVCGVEIFLGLALIKHLHQLHPTVKPYKCEHCSSCLNNLKEMSSHHSVVHRPSNVKCCFCDYKCMTKARMRQHVCIHSKGLRHEYCPKSFPSISSL